jgi:hypothetical protein
VWGLAAARGPSEDKPSEPELNLNGKVTNGINGHKVWKSTVQPSLGNLKPAANHAWSKMRITALNLQGEVVTAWRTLVSWLLDVGKKAKTGVASASDQCRVSTVILVALGPELLPASIVRNPRWNTRCVGSLDESRSYLE